MQMSETVHAPILHLPEEGRSTMIDERAFGIAGFTLAAMLLSRLQAKGLLSSSEAEQTVDVALHSVEAYGAPERATIDARKLLEALRRVADGTLDETR